MANNQLNQIDVQRVPVDLKVLRAFKNESQFTSLAVELLKEVGMLTTLLAYTERLDDQYTPRKWNKNEAILGGLLVRCSKIITAILDQTCQLRMEIVGIVLRSFFESLINIQYLLLKDCDEAYAEYIEYSLREEKRLLNHILENIKKHDGEELPIETRMKESILRAFENSGVNPEDVNEEKIKSWGNSIFGRVKKLGYDIHFYRAIFGLPNHAVHGNWQDLLVHHIVKGKEGYEPASGWTEPRPQHIFVCSKLCIETDLKYLDHLLPSCDDKDRFESRLNEVLLRNGVADQIHEEFLSAKSV